VLVVVAAVVWRVIPQRNRGYANFRELRACELLRIPLPRTRVNKGKKKGRVLEDSTLPSALWRSMSKSNGPNRSVFPDSAYC